MEEHRSILVVDDDEMTRELISHTLREEGFKVTAESDGLHAVVKSSELKPDLIILDMMLPDLSGLEVLSILRIDLLMIVTPVIMISRLGQQKLRHFANKLGATDYLVKPFEMKQLLEKIYSIPGFQSPAVL